MADKTFTPLAHRAVLEVAGADRRTFLQGLISNDVNKVAPGRAIHAAFLTPQGKFLFDLFVAEAGEVLLLDTEAARIGDLLKKLSMYKLRSKVTLALRPDLGVFAVSGAAADGIEATAFPDPRLPAAGWRVIGPAATAAALAEAGFAESPFAAWDEARIRLGLPDGSRDLPVEKAILLENGFEELNGVDFNKGCYLGQELTSRTKYRGLVRKRLMPVLIDGPAPEPGAPVMLGEAEAGEMRSHVGNVGLAMIRLEHFRAAEGQAGAFTAGEARLTPIKPDWAVFPEGE